MSEAPAPAPGSRRAPPLYVWVIVAVVAGILVGWLLGETTLMSKLLPQGQQIGMTVITLLKALATPLILLAVLDAFLRTRIPGRAGVRLLAISVMNATMAVVIALTLANGLHLGNRWQGHVDELKAKVTKSSSGLEAEAAKKQKALTPDANLDPLANAVKTVPDNIIDPVRTNNVIAVVLLAVLAGMALRGLKDRDHPGIAAVEGVIGTLFATCARMIGWVVLAIPFAVFAVVAALVAKSGFGIFLLLGDFVLLVLLGLFLQAVVWYSILLATVGRMSPLTFFRGTLSAITTALSCGSSLATLPVTLRCLDENLHIPPGPARLACCVGTNLNHDGIILYEAMAALFICQALGEPLTVGQQIVVALAAIMAGVGIAGVPDAGWLILPLVLGAIGFPPEKITAVVMLLLPVDWLLGRGRAVTNVISDMTVAVLLHRFERPPPPGTPVPGG